MSVFGSKATLLGSPIGDVSSISDTLSDKADQLRKMGDRLQHVCSEVYACMG